MMADETSKIAKALVVLAIPVAMMGAPTTPAYSETCQELWAKYDYVSQEAAKSNVARDKAFFLQAQDQFMTALTAQGCTQAIGPRKDQQRRDLHARAVQLYEKAKALAAVGNWQGAAEKLRAALAYFNSLGETDNARIVQTNLEHAITAVARQQQEAAENTFTPGVARPNTAAGAGPALPPSASPAPQSGISSPSQPRANDGQHPRGTTNNPQLANRATAGSGGQQPPASGISRPSPGTDPECRPGVNCYDLRGGDRTAMAADNTRPGSTGATPASGISPPQAASGSARPTPGTDPECRPGVNCYDIGASGGPSTARGGSGPERGRPDREPAARTGPAAAQSEGDRAEEYLARVRRSEAAINESLRSLPSGPPATPGGEPRVIDPVPVDRQTTPGSSGPPSRQTSPTSGGAGLGSPSAGNTAASAGASASSTSQTAANRTSGPAGPTPSGGTATEQAGHVGAAAGSNAGTIAPVESTAPAGAVSGNAAAPEADPAKEQKVAGLIGEPEPKSPPMPVNERPILGLENEVRELVGSGQFQRELDGSVTASLQPIAKPPAGAEALMPGPDPLSPPCRERFESFLDQAEKGDASGAVAEYAKLHAQCGTDLSKIADAARTRMPERVMGPLSRSAFGRAMRANPSDTQAAMDSIVQGRSAALPDALAFDATEVLNFGVAILGGAASIYMMNRAARVRTYSAPAQAAPQSPQRTYPGAYPSYPVGTGGDGNRSGISGSTR